MEEFDNQNLLIQQLDELLEKYPHLLISKQKVVDRNERQEP
jgi:hypothetical protein